MAESHKYDPNEWKKRPHEVTNFTVVFTHPNNGCTHSGDVKTAFLRGLSASDVLGAIYHNPDDYPPIACDDCDAYYSEVSVL